MNLSRHTKKIVIASLLLVGMQAAFAAISFTGITDEKAKASRYSLKNLGSLSHKSLSYGSLKTSLQFKGIQSYAGMKTNGGQEIKSLMRYDNGNTAYIQPYKLKVKVPKFKTPAPQPR